MAKKKYYQSMHDRMDESKGMNRRLHELKGREMYASDDSRRELERKDFHMINEDHSCIANLPQEVMMKPFPRMRYGLDPYLDDTVTGIDKQMYADEKGMKSHISKSKY